MKLQGIPNAKIDEELKDIDVGRLKVWMRKYLSGAGPQAGNTEVIYLR